MTATEETKNLVETICKERFGFITSLEVEKIMNSPCKDDYQWRSVLVRLQSGNRLTTPLRYLNDLIKTVEKGGDHVRDASFSTNRFFIKPYRC